MPDFDVPLSPEDLELLGTDNPEAISRYAESAFDMGVCVIVEDLLLLPWLPPSGEDA